MGEFLEERLARACELVLPLLGVGQTAQYIPALAEVDINKFGASIVLLSGESAVFGHWNEQFSIQSISKVLTLAAALSQIGDVVWDRVSYEPSGNPFNSIVQLELEKGIPRNPFINAGALVVCDVLLSNASAKSALDCILDQIRILAQDETIVVDQRVVASELSNAYRNLSLLHFMKSFHNIKHDIGSVLDLYCSVCSIAMNSSQLANAFSFLANGGVDPTSGQVIVSSKHARHINSIMMMCGHYDASGDFAIRVGLPGKSGVGGGIVSIVPNIGVICTWSPGLNRSGNSTVATAATEAIVNEMGWGVF